VDEASPLSRASFKTVIPISMPVHIPPPTRAFSEVEWLTLEAGHRSRDMEDKWFSFVERDRLFLHRSWTGHGIFECRFEPHEGHWSITGAVVEGDLTVYRRDGHSDDYENQLLERIIVWLLGLA
jgi:hypothetical protein